MSKFNNKKIEHAGIWFDSKLEKNTYDKLLLRQRAREILVVQCQDHIYLTDAEILYKPDFKCLDLTSENKSACIRLPDPNTDDPQPVDFYGEFFWVEAKGYQDQKWPIKKRLWQFYGPGRLEIWKSPGWGRPPELDETIIVGSKKKKKRVA